MSDQTTSSTSRSQRSYLKPVIVTQSSSKSRDSSRESQHSRSSTDSRYTSSSNDSMGSSNRGSMNDDRVTLIQRVPENKRHFITTTSSGKTDIHHQGMARYDREEPRASYATSEDYKRKQERQWREREARRRSGGQ